MSEASDIYPADRYLGQRRDMGDREQVCLGPCRRCGGPVWRYVDDPVSDAPPIHKRLCRDLEAAGV